MGGYNVSGLYLWGVTMYQDYSCGGLQCIRIIVVRGVAMYQDYSFGGYNVSGL